MTITLPCLPYEPSALEPYISRRTIDYHYGKHHQGYVTKLNALVQSTSWSEKSAFEIFTSTVDQQIFNNAAQVWNHSFFWCSLTPDGGGAAKGPLAKKVQENFGGYAEFRDELLSAAVSHFSSGWVWLVYDGVRLSIVTTKNANTPIPNGVFPLLTIDIWEHAYYLDYQNRRDLYVEAVLDKLINWRFAAINFERCESGHPEDIALLITDRVTVANL